MSGGRLRSHRLIKASLVPATSFIVLTVSFVLATCSYQEESNFSVGVIFDPHSGGGNEKRSFNYALLSANSGNLH